MLYDEQTTSTVASKQQHSKILGFFHAYKFYDTYDQYWESGVDTSKSNNIRTSKYQCSPDYQICLLLHDVIPTYANNRGRSATPNGHYCSL